MYLQTRLFLNDLLVMQITPHCLNRLRQSNSQKWSHCSGGSYCSLFFTTIRGYRSTVIRVQGHMNRGHVAPSPRLFLTDLISLIAQHRLKYSLGPQTTKSLTLSCKKGSSPKHNLLLHPLLS